MTPADRGYLYQQNIPNLTILNGAQVGKVILSSDSTPRATGVQYRDQNGNTYTVNANLEVIVATGAIKTPVILQQSGIGPASVLQSAGVTQRVDLPVGLNLIDQTTTTTDWSFRGKRGGGQVITFPRFQDMFSGNDATTMQNILQNDLGSYAQAAVDAGAFSTASGLQTILEIQRGWILNQGVGFSENFDYSFGELLDHHGDGFPANVRKGKTLGYDSWYLLPFGRGSVKITGNDPYSSSGFSIDPRYFSTQFDSLAQGATARFTRTVSTTSPLSNDVTGESVPGGAVGNGASLQTWATWAENNYRSNWHPIGTAAMMSQNLGGCVNSNNSVVRALRPLGQRHSSRCAAYKRLG
jgi:choline dehydrogenase-like flavoprotein